jgi:hypothetical protein
MEPEGSLPYSQVTTTTNTTTITTTATTTPTTTTTNYYYYYYYHYCRRHHHHHHHHHYLLLTKIPETCNTNHLIKKVIRREYCQQQSFLSLGKQPTPTH